MASFNNKNNGLLAAAKSEYSQPRNKEEDVAPAPAVLEETTSVGSADRIGPEVIKPLENVRVASG